MKREKYHLSLSLFRRIFGRQNSVCALCGKPTGRNRYQVGKAAGGPVWLCFHCASRNYRKQLEIDPETGTVTVLSPGGTPAPAPAERKRPAPDGEPMRATTDAVRPPEEDPRPIPEPDRAPAASAEPAAVIHVAAPEDSAAGDIASSPMLLADEVQKYKDKLDSGTITEEEFQMLKRKLLGLE